LHGDQGGGCQLSASRGATWTQHSGSTLTWHAGNFIEKAWLKRELYGFCNPSGVTSSSHYFSTTAPPCCMRERFCSKCNAFVSLERAHCERCLDGATPVDGVCQEPMCEVLAACPPSSLALPLSLNVTLCAHLSMVPTIINQLVNVTAWSLAPQSSSLSAASPLDGTPLDLTMLISNFTGSFLVSVLERSSINDFVIALTLRQQDNNAGVVIWAEENCTSQVRSNLEDELAIGEIY